MTISDVMSSPLGQIAFSHKVFQTVDVEDTVFELCKSLQELRNDFAPIATSDDGAEAGGVGRGSSPGTVVAVLGYLDIVNLLDQAAKQCPHLFTERVEQLRSTTTAFTRVRTAPWNAPFAAVLSLMHEHGLSGVPVVDDHMRVVGIYHKEDANLIAVTPVEQHEQLLSCILDMPIGDIVRHQQQPQPQPSSLLPSPSAAAVTGSISGTTMPMPMPMPVHSSASSVISAAPPSPGSPPSGSSSSAASLSLPWKLCTCKPRDRMMDVLDMMMRSRVTRVVCVDDNSRCLGLISIEDIMRFFYG